MESKAPRPDNLINKKERLYYLDTIKALLIFLVIAHHVGQAYGPTGGFWQYKSSLNESIPWLGYFFGVNAAFFMGLFFMISGYFIPGSYDRKGSWEFIKDKLKRYGIPVLFALLIMQPFIMYFYYELYSGNPHLGFFQYYINIYWGIGTEPIGFTSAQGWPYKGFGHLWFVEHLLLYSTIYCLVRMFFKRRESNNKPKSFGFVHIILLALIIAIISYVVRLWYPIDKWIGILGFIQSEVAHLPQYAILFISGILAYRNGWFSGCSRRTGYISLAIGAVMAALVYFNSFIPETVLKVIFFNWGFYESFMAVFLCWGLVVLFREKLNFTSPLLKFLSENAYASYILHYPIVLAIQYSLDKVQIFGAPGKFITVTILSIIVTFGVSSMVRKIPLVKRIA